MRIWVDLTNSPHVVIFRPLIARLQARGHEVTVTSRDFAQTLGLLERFEISHRIFGAHGGASLVGKARATVGRTAALVRFARRERFDLAVAHGSTDQPIAARLAGNNGRRGSRLRPGGLDTNGLGPRDHGFQHFARRSNRRRGGSWACHSQPRSGGGMLGGQRRFDEQTRSVQNSQQFDRHGP